MKGIHFSRNFSVRAAGLILLLMLSGCASTGSDSRDPWEGWNRNVQGFNDTIDDYALKPAAKGYQWITPSFVDTGVTNFFSNIGDIRVFINDFLQFKLKQGGLDVSRFLVNSTLGLGGLFDVATLLELEKHNEDFGQTLGYWGVPPGPYLVLPLLGPSSPRGVVGLVGDTATTPLTYLGFVTSNPSVISLPLNALNLIDLRADNLTTTKIAEEAAVDRYDFIRNAYRQRREFLVHDGEPPLEDEDYEDEFLDDEDFEDDSFDENEDFDEPIE